MDARLNHYYFSNAAWIPLNFGKSVTPLPCGLVVKIRRSCCLGPGLIPGMGTFSIDDVISASTPNNYPFSKLKIKHFKDVHF